jgi:hypothetical protein
MRLAKCPAGYTMRRDDLFPDQDACTPCDRLTYLLDPVSNASIACLPCPLGAACPGGSEVSALPGYWRKFASDEDRAAAPAPAAAAGNRRLGCCDGGAGQAASCCPADVVNAAGTPNRAMLFRCPPGERSLRTGVHRV